MDQLRKSNEEQFSSENNATIISCQRKKLLILSTPPGDLLFPDADESGR
jgi:hypothetical protein